MPALCFVEEEPAQPPSIVVVLNQAKVYVYTCVNQRHVMIPAGISHKRPGETAGCPGAYKTHDNTSGKARAHNAVGYFI
jgi:hypothetical protein